MVAIIKSPVVAHEFVELGTAKPTPVVEVHEVVQVQRSFENEIADIDGATVGDEPVSIEPQHTASEDGSSQYTFEDFMEMHRETLRSIEEKAMKEGYEQGYLKGEGDAYGKYTDALSQFQRLAEVGQYSVADMLKKSEILIGAIVFEATTKILGKELITIDGCRSAVAQVIQDIDFKNILKIKVSSHDFERLNALEGNWHHPSESSLVSLPFEADSSVELGGCLVELADGRNIDGRIETQLQIFAQSLKEALHGISK